MTNDLDSIVETHLNANDPMPDFKTSQEDEISHEEDIEELELQKKLEKRRHSKAEREKYRLAHELEMMTQENMALRQASTEMNERLHYLNQQAAQAGEAAIIHHANNLHLKEAQLKEALKKAHEYNDSENIPSITAELSRISTEIQNFDNWKANEQLRFQKAAAYEAQLRQQASQNSPLPYASSFPQEEETYNSSMMDEGTQEWLQENSWFVPGNPEYDEEKAKSVMAFAEDLDEKIKKSGQIHIFNTPEYYYMIDEYANKLERGLVPHLEMRSQHQIAPARYNGYQNGNLAARRAIDNVQLTQNEKEMARRAGISEKTWKEHKLIEIRKQRARQMERQRI